MGSQREPSDRPSGSFSSGQTQQSSCGCVPTDALLKTLPQHLLYTRHNPKDIIIVLKVHNLLSGLRFTCEVPERERTLGKWPGMQGSTWETRVPKAGCLLLEPASTCCSRGHRACFTPPMEIHGGEKGFQDTFS